MVAAAKPNEPSIFAQLDATQVVTLRAQMLLTAKELGGVKGRRLRRVAEDDQEKGPLRNRLMERTTNRLFNRFLDDTGAKLGSKKAGAGEFLTWVLNFIKENPEVVVRIVMTILSMFGL